MLSFWEHICIPSKTGSELMAELLLDLRKPGLYPGYLWVAECNSKEQEKVPGLDMDLSRASCTRPYCELLSDRGVVRILWSL